MRETPTLVRAMRAQAEKDMRRYRTAEGTPKGGINRDLSDRILMVLTRPMTVDDLARRLSANRQSIRACCDRLSIRHKIKSSHVQGYMIYEPKEGE